MKLLAAVIGLFLALSGAAQASQFYVTMRTDSGKLYLHFVPPDGNWEWKPTTSRAEIFDAKEANHTVGEIWCGKNEIGCWPVRRERVR